MDVMEGEQLKMLGCHSPSNVLYVGVFASI